MLAEINGNCLAKTNGRPLVIAGGDLDAVVGVLDLDIMASQWLGVPGTPSADIAPSPTDGQVNFLDYVVLAELWLQIAQ